MSTATAGLADTDGVVAASGARSFLAGLAKGTGSVVMVLLLVLALAIAVVPRIMGGAALTVLTGSMQPTHAPGDMVISVPQDRYQVGDVVTFQPVSDDPMLITHRVVAVRLGADGTSYVTRGDANGADDEPISAEQVMGRVLYEVPYVGHVAQAAGSQRALLVTGTAVALLAYGAFLVVSDTVRGRQGGRGRAAHHTTMATPSSDTHDDMHDDMHDHTRDDMHDDTGSGTR